MRSRRSAALQWWSDSVLLVRAPDDEDEREVREAMGYAAHAAGRVVSSTYRTAITGRAARGPAPGPYLVAWCPLARARTAT